VSGSKVDALGHHQGGLLETGLTLESTLTMLPSGLGLIIMEKIRKRLRVADLLAAIGSEMFSYSLEFNPHSSGCETMQAYCARYDLDVVGELAGDGDLFAICVYPDNPVGSYGLIGCDLVTLLETALDTVRAAR
jgi:hypothetical protein